MDTRVRDTGLLAGGWCRLRDRRDRGSTRFVRAGERPGGRGRVDELATRANALMNEDAAEGLRLATFAREEARKLGYVEGEMASALARANNLGVRPQQRGYRGAR